MSTRDNMKRLMCCLTLALIFPVSGIANSPLVPAAPSINADSYLLIDFDTGAVLLLRVPL